MLPCQGLEVSVLGFRRLDLFRLYALLDKLEAAAIEFLIMHCKVQDVLFIAAFRIRHGAASLAHILLQSGAAAMMSWVRS